MKVVTTHVSPDFDGFAAAVAYRKLHPEYVVVVSGRFQQNLEEFLHLYEFEYIRDNEIKNNITELVIVDNASLDRVGKKIADFAADASIKVIDHHPDIKKSDMFSDIIHENVGAVTTLLVLMLKDSGIRLTSEEATLFATAIYEDTGNFLYSTTTPRDLMAAQFLLENGARLEEIAQFVKLDLNTEQKVLFETLINNIKVHTIKGYDVAVASTEIEKFIGGLNIITSKIWAFGEYETLIVVTRMGKKVFVVGRTKSPDVDLKKLMNFFGGNGHNKAASATLTNVSVEEVIYKVLEKLPECINVSLKAKDIMSSPVRTIFAYETIRKAHEIMQITGHGGLPVVEGNRLIGIVTRKAVDKALNHGFGERPVKSIMNTKLVTVNEDEPILKIRDVMIEHDIGRIPVLNKDNILSGVITRSDLLKAFDSSQVQKQLVKNVLNFEDVKDILIRRLPRRLLNLLRLLGEYGDDVNMPVYVVGGFVRDLLLGIENLDVDIVVEGDGLKFAEYAAKQIGAKMVPYEKFLTASLFFKDGFRIDIATARTEYYEKPAKLPMVDISTIKKDLYRRDFTINAMAIKLNPLAFGILFDFFQSRKDLKEGIIRVLHRLSFVEDPTRIIRAVRFEQRFGFHIEETTQEILTETLEGGYLEKVTGSRIRQEIEKILEEQSSLKAIRRLAELNILKHIFPKTYYTGVMDKKLVNMYNFFQKLGDIYKNYNKFYCVLRVLLEFYDENSLKEVARRYGIPKKFVEETKFSEKIVIPVKEMIHDKMLFSDIYKVLGKPSPETACYISAYLECDDQEYFYEYLKKVYETKLEKVSGEYVMKKYGIKAGPIIGKIMNELFCKKLDDMKIDEIFELERIIKNLRGEDE
ncbi:CBS domain-containing protein [Thermosipho ferrireducens]|uniref:CBS domain-containing protein n=1 Tax=Thermosipho ferrireducens TaxID=2571116 RepID=A0ABX7S7N0_9BACT|nr:CBS domain-containing protein [Thermosipho ferrireducens]QTA37851.1 CBS domain-containing protein [Thermosipho ferrireducens]